MGRGGKRAGTGPKPVLGEDAFLCRMAIGIEFERRWRNLSIWRSRARQPSAGLGAELENDLDTINALHPRLVRKADGKPVRQIIVELSDTPEHQWPDDLPDFIIEGAYALLNRRENISAGQRSRGTHEQPVRPQGSRNRLIAKVAAWATRRYRARITPRFVRACIEDYRRFLKN